MATDDAYDLFRKRIQQTAGREAAFEQFKQKNNAATAEHTAEWDAHVAPALGRVAAKLNGICAEMGRGDTFKLATATPGAMYIGVERRQVLRRSQGDRVIGAYVVILGSGQVDIVKGEENFRRGHLASVALADCNEAWLAKVIADDAARE